MSATAIVYFSGYGHTAKQASFVEKGASSVGGATHMVAIDQEGNITDQEWALLAASDALIFGSPTYMGGVAWQFKKFADTSSKVWFSQNWKDKLAAGFTNSATINGDKAATMLYLMTFAMQHSMLWIGTGMMPANAKAATRNDVNWLGGFSGALAQSPSDSSAEEAPFPGDLETARLFGRRVGEWAARLKKA